MLLESQTGQPTVSVVIPTHNRPALLNEALLSVLNQTAPPAEIIVVDDASQPPAQISTSRPGVTIRHIRHSEKRGGAAAKNTGALAAHSELIAFLDDDDLIAPSYLERASHCFTSHPNIDVLYMAIDWFGKHAERSRQNYMTAMQRLLDEAEGRTISPDILKFGDALIMVLLNRVPMAFQRPVVRRDAFIRIGRYTEHCLLWDCDWALRAALAGNVALNEVPLYLQRSDAQGYSSHPDRQIEHTLSNIEIRERLAATLSMENAPTRKLQQAFKRSTGQNWRHLAYQQHQNGNNFIALKAWLRSVRMDRKPSLKLLLRILLNLSVRT